ncbi:hypothetical protein [Brevundimonas sp. DC300-4]|uniref:hypothetical protein n=1 Tax=Brevundimonas sp. DC300-4 TaxID=2804594 RepID=UPI003CF1B6F6
MTTPRPAPVYEHEVSANRPFRWRKPEQDPGLMFRRGPFSGVVTPTEQARISGRYPDTVFIGLMIKLPRPDGTGGREVDAVVYERQQVRLEPRDQQSFCVPMPIHFDVHRLPAVAGVALFDQSTGGELVGYGAISSVNIQVQPNSRVEIPGYRLIVKRCANVGWAAQ